MTSKEVFDLKTLFYSIFYHYNLMDTWLTLKTTEQKRDFIIKNIVVRFEIDTDINPITLETKLELYVILGKKGTECSKNLLDIKMWDDLSTVFNIIYGQRFTDNIIKCDINYNNLAKWL